ncbi:cell division protein ZapA [Pseudotabrizicola sp. L79]|uniref:cell division protein ZapA n=1 Tax=Pseudotabrizicola sp. L79 TaxID=3118402 RepID=UPI002F92A378
MPDVTITIGGRDFQVACQTGEEHFLRAAAGMLNAEADPLVQQMGRLPEARMLLMAGLMLADKTAAVEDELRQLKARLTELEARPAPQAEKVEVPVIPPQLRETLAEIAARAEALADRVDDKAD